MLDLNALLQPVTADNVTATIISLLATARWPATAWQPGSWTRTIVGILSKPIADISASVLTIARGGYLDTAEGDWLTLLASSLYEVDRWTAQTNRVLVALTDTAGVGPQSFSAGSLVLGDQTSSLTFTNMASITLPLNGTVNAVFEATTSGSASNTPGANLTTVRSGGVAGLQVQSLTTSTSQTRPGTDDEIDSALRLRCRKKWSTLACVGTPLSLEYYATSIGPSITRALSTVNPTTGAVTVYCAGPSSNPTPSTTDLANVTTILTGSRKPLCATVSVLAAPIQTLSITATVTVKPSYQYTAPNIATANFLAYLDTIPMGGQIDGSRLIGCFAAVPGVSHVNVFYSGNQMATSDLINLNPGSVPYVNASAAITYQINP